MQVEEGSPLTDLNIDVIANALVDLLLARLAAKAPVREPILSTEVDSGVRLDSGEQLAVELPDLVREGRQVGISVDPLNVSTD